MAKIVIGGFLHETNTFAPDIADWDAFLAGGGWPGVLMGEQLFTGLKNKNISASGFIELAQADGHELIPTIWCAASPSAHVEKETYEKVAAIILDGIRAALPVDAVYLDLHGAMVAQHVDDGEGELLRRVRELVGEQVKIVSSLDLHANVTQLMLTSADALVAYRTYPHVDMADTGKRAYRLLQKSLAMPDKRPMHFRRIPFLVPICWQCTDIEPAKSLYAELASLENQKIDLSFAMCFPAADFSECSPVVWGYGEEGATIVHEVDILAQRVIDAESSFAGKLYTPDEAVVYAMQKAATASKPIVIADAQDNPGAGSNSDTTGMLRALIRNQAEDAAIGLIVDPEAAAFVYQHKEGESVTLALGGKSGIPNDSPLEATFVIEKLYEGKLEAKGPYYNGFSLNLGKAACLRIGGVRVILASNKVQMADRVMFQGLGVNPLTQKILVLKSAVHFRADFTPIAREIIVAKAPGSMPMVLSELPWKHLQKGIRIDPCGEVF